jgi:hypothetical protein
MWGANVALCERRAACVPANSNHAMRNTIHKYYRWSSLTAYEILRVPVLNSGSGICFAFDVADVRIIVTLPLLQICYLCFFIRVVLLLIVMFYLLFMCKCVLPPGVNPIAVEKCININSFFTTSFIRTDCWYGLFPSFSHFRFSFFLMEKYVKLPIRAVPAACCNLVTRPCVASLSSIVTKSC